MNFVTKFKDNPSYVYGEYTGNSDNICFDNTEIDCQENP